MSLIQLIVERGPEATDAKLKGIMKSEEAVAETIENNVRKLITNESPVDPAYYEKMSKLLDALIELRRNGVVNYKDYLDKIAKLTKEATRPGGGAGGYPASVKTAAQRALYNNLGKDDGLALTVDAAIHGSRMDGWRDNAMKTKKVRIAIKAALDPSKSAPPAGATAFHQDMARDDYPLEALTDRILEMAMHQHDY
jgi:type I restriction enzyme R subunit